MEFPDDGDTGAALTSLDLVVHGLGFGNQKGKEEEAAIASADFRDFVEHFVVRAKREDDKALLKRSRWARMLSLVSGHCYVGRQDRKNPGGCS